MGFTGGNICGHLGGFKQSSLEDLGNNTYRVDRFICIIIHIQIVVY